MDVLVVGAGVVGSAIADLLVRRGAKVSVLDMRAPGRGASHASAGLLAPYTEAHADSALLPLGVRSLELYDDFVNGARERSGQPVEYARTGTLETALTDDDVKRLAGTAQWLGRRGVSCQWIEGADLARFEPALAVAARGALFVPAHGFVGVRSLVTALVQSARWAGATFESPVEVVEIHSNDCEVLVRTGVATYTADRVIVAAGTWTSRVRVHGASRLPVRPVRGQLLHLAWTESAPPVRPVWTHDCYVVPWPDGSVLVGATVEEAGFDESTTVAGVQALTRAACAAVPGAASARLVEVRVGLRPATPDGLPYIGAFESAPNVIFATGHYRNGVLLAPVTAEMVAALVLDSRFDMDATWHAVSPNRLN